MPTTLTNDDVGARLERGERLMLDLYRNGHRSGCAPVSCVIDLGDAVRVVRVTRQDHDHDHRALKFRVTLAQRWAVRRPNDREAKEHNRLWLDIEQWCARRKPR